jgi:hypothetical protein
MRRERREQFGDASAIERRTDMGDAHRAHPIRFRGYSLQRRRADERLVLFERMKPEGGSLNGGTEHRHRRGTFMVIALRQCGSLNPGVAGRFGESATFGETLDQATPVPDRRGGRQGRKSRGPSRQAKRRGCRWPVQLPDHTHPGRDAPESEGSWRQCEVSNRRGAWRPRPERRLARDNRDRSV